MQFVRSPTELILNQTNKRQFWGWINIIFNRVDKERLKQFGPDRTCAEWILRNGGAVRFKGVEHFLANYNLLPPEGTKFQIEEIDATESSIMHYGFDHFEGCDHIRNINLNKCGYLQDKALTMLHPLNDTLRTLQVTSCLNITEEGLYGLTNLTQLEKLQLSNLPYVKRREEVLKSLKQQMPTCDIQYN